MAKRPLNKKRAARVRKMLRRDIPAFIDLIEWLKVRGYAQTTGQAERLILDGKVKSESHKLGIARGQKLKSSARIKAALGRRIREEDFDEVDVVQRYVPAKVRGTIQVSGN